MSLARRNDACYECCKRRIQCDKTGPECRKCIKKGIRCSGPGLSCNLSSYMTSSGSHPHQDVTGPVQENKAPSSQHSETKSETTSAASLRWVKVGQVSRRSRKSRARSSSGTNSSGASIDCNNSPNPADEEENQVALVHLPISTASPRLLLTIDDALHPNARMLFNHFSEAVAPIMVALDSVRNGYRDIILPLACQDQVLGRAVCVTAAFHLAQKSQGIRHTAEMGYQIIIERLQRDSMLLQPGHVFNQYTLATILVLLVGETITGIDNYVHLLDMLECFMQSPGALSSLPSALQPFFSEQIRMFQLFGIPLSDEKKGLQITQTPPERYMDFIAYPSLPNGSDLDRNIRVIQEAITDACAIYRRRVESNLDRDESIQIIHQLQQKVLKLDTCAMGGHALVWTYFIAAAESILPQHREFFSKRLKELHIYTGFGCILASLQTLEKIWGLQATRRWTQVVTNDVFILVM